MQLRRGKGSLHARQHPEGRTTLNCKIRARPSVRPSAMLMTQQRMLLERLVDVKRERNQTSPAAAHLASLASATPAMARCC
jgi:hypothetical protein